MGGSSKSSSSQQSNQTTTQLTSDGVIAGDLFQGGSVSVTQQFGDNVARAFEQLIDLSAQSLDIASGAGQIAIETVASTKESTDNPQLATLSKFTPIIMFSIAAVAAIVIFRKR